MKLHVCYRVGKGNFRCSACDFFGTLVDVTWHVVENQFTVEYKPRPKPPAFLLGRPNFSHKTEPYQ